MTAEILSIGGLVVLLASAFAVLFIGAAVAVSIILRELDKFCSFDDEDKSK